MKHISLSSALLIAIFTACTTGPTEPTLHHIEPSSNKIELSAQNATFDTIPGVIGMVQKSDSSYFFYLYRSDHCLMETDSDFNIRGFAAKIGEGPHEVRGVAPVYGDILNSGATGFLDPYTFVLYRLSDSLPRQAVEVVDFAGDLAQYQPLYSFSTSDSTYVIVPGIYQYGLIGYNAASHTIDTWPVGYTAFDTENPVKHITSFRDAAFNKKHGIIAETYGKLPLLILHNTNGDITSMLAYGDLPDIDTLQEDDPDPFAAIKLTDNNIYILYRDNDEAPRNDILVIGYDGTLIATLGVDAAYTFEVDPDCRRIICINPNDDDAAVKFYSIPDIIAQP